MRNMLIGAAVAAGMLTAGAANAALIDFTNEASYSNGTFAFSTSSITGSVSGVNFSLIPTPANGTLTRTTGDAPGSNAAPLNGSNDGIGIDTDEVNFTAAGGPQQLTLTFAREVTVNTLYFLDMFTQPNAGDDDDKKEAVTVSYGANSQTFRSTEEFVAGRFGFKSFGGLSLTGTSFVFTPTTGTDLQADPDFAFAGVDVTVSDVAPVPLPAGIVLMGTAMAGFGAMRRRKAKTAA